MARQKTKICLSCSQLFRGRADAKTCSERCRKQLNRAKLAFSDEAQSLTASAQKVLRSTTGALKSLESNISSELPQFSEFGFIGDSSSAVSPTPSVLPAPTPQPATPQPAAPQPVAPPVVMLEPEIQSLETKPSAQQWQQLQDSWQLPPTQPPAQPTPLATLATNLSTPAVNPALVSQSAPAAVNNQTLAAYPVPVVPIPIQTLAAPMPTDQGRGPGLVNFFKRRPIYVSLSFVALIALISGAFALSGLLHTSQPTTITNLSFQDLDNALLAAKGSNLTINLSTVIANGKTLTLGQIIADPTTGILQLSGDLNASGSLGASGGASSLNNAGLTINNTLVCTAAGCSGTGATGTPARTTLQGNNFNGTNQLVQLTASGALPALNGSNLTTLNGSNISSGTLNNARLASSVTLQGNSFNSANQLVQLTAGGLLPILSGTNLTNVDAITLQGNNAAFYTNATNLSTGTLADARLSTNVALLNGTGPQTFTGNNKFTGTVLSQNTTDSTTAFQIQNAAGTSTVLSADTTNSRIGIGTASPITQLHVSGAVPTAATGSVATGTDPLSVYVQGRYAYVVNNNPSNTLQIFDVSNPAAPINISTVATGTTPIFIYVQGHYAYVVNQGSNTLQIFDVSNPAAPTSVGTVATGTQPNSVYVQGRYAYVVNLSSNNLQIFDVSNPAAPTSVGTVATGSVPLSVYVQGRYAYVVNLSSNNLQIFDVSNPAAPTSVGTVATGVQPFFVYVQGRYAYVANNSTGTLQIFDVSNPATPVSVGLVAAGTLPRSVYVQGRYAYVANTNDSTLQIFDVSNPATPTSVGAVATGTSPQSIYVQGRYVYVANRAANTLQIFDVGGAYIQQLEAGGIETGTFATRSNLQVGNDADIRGGLTVGQNVQISGNLGVSGSAYVSGSTPTVATGSVADDVNPQSVYVQGRYAYVVNAGGSSTLKIFDISNPATPVNVGSVAVDSGPSTSVYVQGRYAYVTDANNNTLQIFDISNPATPVNVSSVAAGSNYPESVYVQGRYAYVTSGNANGNGSNTLQIFDVSNPATPVSAGSVTTGAGSNPDSVYVQGRYAYVANAGASNTLQIFDVSNPAAPVSVGLVATNSGPISVYVQGRYAYVVNTFANTLQIFDVSNPAAPISAGSVATDANTTSVYVQGRYAYVTNGTYNGIGGNSLQIFDVSSPALPAIVGSVTTGGGPQSVYVQGRYAYVANAGGVDTLQIFDVGGAYIQQLEAGGIETGTFATRSNLQVGNDADVRGGLTIGQNLQISGNIGASGSVLFQNAANSTTAFQVQDTGANTILKVDTSTNSGEVSLWLSTTTATERLCSTVTNGVASLAVIRDCAGTPGDYAEDYGTSDVSIEAGDIVALDPSRPATENIDANGFKGSRAWIIKATDQNQSHLLGVVSTQPNETIGQNFTPVENPRPVTISGRVPVKVSAQNGPVTPGDYITASSEPGVAMKASSAGWTLGIALSGFDGPGNGTVIVSTNRTWYTPPLVAAGGLQGGSSVVTSLMVSGELTTLTLTVNGDAQFKGNITLAGHIIGNPDTSGTLHIDSGQQNVSHSFNTGYASVPKVVITPSGDLGNLHWWVTKTATDFTLHLSDPAASALDFDYIIQQ